MPRFELTSPEGKRFEITAPEGATQEQVMQYAEQQFSAPKPEQAQPEAGLGRTLFDQGMQGATFGFADEIQDRIGAGIASVFTDESYDDLLGYAREDSQKRLQKQMQDRPGASIAANIAGGLVTGGAAATTKAGTAVGNSLRAGGLPARIAKGSMAGAASGAAYGAGTSEDGKRLEGAGQGALYGAVGGAAIPAAGAALKGAGNAIIPAVDDALKPLAKRAKELGVPLRLDQVSPTRARKTVQKASQVLPFNGVDAFEDAQRKSFNKALAKTIGLQTDDLSPDAIQQFLVNADKKFGVITRGKKIPTAGISQRLDDILQDASETLTEDLYGVVAKNAEKVKVDFVQPIIDGSKLASLRSQLVQRSTRVQGGAKEYIGEIIDAIDDIAATQLTKAQRKVLQQARREYRNFKTLEPLLENSTDGQINPTQLLTRVKASPYIKASRTITGEDDLVDLARIGKEFLPKAGGSDTFEKMTLGAGAATGALNPTTLAPMAAGVGANRAFQSGYNQSQRLVNAAINKAGSQGASGGAAGAIGGGTGGAAIENAIGNTAVGVSPGRPVINIRPNAMDEVGGGISNDTLQTNYFDRLAQAESGGNPNAKAKTSSASGLFQFTDGTWRDMVKKYGKEYGITMRDKNNPEAQRIMVEKFTEENAQVLSKVLGRAPNDGELYLAHFAGAGGAKRLLKARGKKMPAAKILPSAAKANRTIFYDGRRARTPDEVISLLASKVT